jgi:Predicted membrane protein
MDAEDLVPHRLAEYYLGNAPSLIWLLFADAVGFLVGVRYYVETIPAVPTFLWPLYGDSPTAMAFFALSLATLLPHLGEKVAEAPVNRPLAYLHTLAFASLVKYGLWTFLALNLHPELYFGFGLDALYSYWGILLTHLGFVAAALLTSGLRRDDARCAGADGRLPRRQ